jgi:hypothetical protein
MRQLHVAALFAYAFLTCPEFVGSAIIVATGLALALIAK